MNDSNKKDPGINKLCVNFFSLTKRSYDWGSDQDSGFYRSGNISHGWVIIINVNLLVCISMSD